MAIDPDSARLTLARSLLPTVRDLKWSLRRDKLARAIRARSSAEPKHEEQTKGGEGGASSIARALVPAIRALQWSLRRDQLARMVRGKDELPVWLAARGGVVSENERYRLAVCPGVKKIVASYERLTCIE